MYIYNGNVQFEWDEDKAAANLGKHGVSFEEATLVFSDPHQLEGFDEAHSDEELRFYIIGFSSQRLLYVVYTEREGGRVIRIIMARKAENIEEQEYVEGS